MDHVGGNDDQATSPAPAGDRSLLVNALELALTASLIDLQYVRVAPDESLFDDALGDVREEAIADFRRYLEDREEEGPALKQGLAWMLSLPPEQFADFVRRIKVPYPYFKPTELHQFLELLAVRTWGYGWDAPQGGTP